MADVLNDKVIFDNYLTRTMARPPTCGAAAAVICSASFAKRHGLTRGVKYLRKRWRQTPKCLGKIKTSI